LSVADELFPRIGGGLLLDDPVSGRGVHGNHAGVGGGERLKQKREG
jgi:hypothetical protein